MKQEYIELITQELNKTDDLSLLDLVLQIMVKSNYKATTATKTNN